MRLNNLTRFLAFLLAVSGSVLWIACNKADSRASAASPDGKIPITTKSDDARKEFLQGRELSDKLLAQDSLQHYDKAISLDPDFAAAELARAGASPTAKEFFDHLKKAVALADKASPGEKLMILATEAGANGEAAEQKQYLEKLVASYPNDERAHFALGGYHFGQQEFEQAITHYRKATDLAPNYSSAYNILGYSYRQAGDFPNAEQAFKKYIELIPNDPNPYDSYAELLLRMGRFEESIAQYRKALSVDPKFFPSHLGISADLTYMGKPDEAVSELQKVEQNARNDGETRAAQFAMTVVDVDRGRMDGALKLLDEQYALGEKTNDVAAMSGDLQAKGNIFLELQKYDDAKKQFDDLVQLVDGSSLSQEIKDNSKLFHHYNLAAVAVGKKDFAAAKSETEEFRQKAETSKNPIQVKQAHELEGIVALAQKDYEGAIMHLEQASQQNPRNLFRLCQAYQAKGNTEKAQTYCGQVAGFNSLPLLNYAFVRTKAQKAVKAAATKKVAPVKSGN
jgi:tetratricopeptide (TPR) repeat protein